VRHSGFYGLQLHRERAVVDRSTDMCAEDHHVGRALREDNHGPRMFVRTRTRRASCRPGGGRPSSSPERPCPRGSHVGSFGQTFTTSDPAPHSGSQLPSESLESSCHVQNQDGGSDCVFMGLVRGKWSGWYGMSDSRCNLHATSRSSHLSTCDL